MKARWIMIFLVCLPLSSQTLSIKELMNPGVMMVRDGDAYISDGFVVYKYSINGMRLNLKLGREGKGPGEASVLPNSSVGFSISDRYILVNSMYKIAIFSREDGGFIRELQTGNSISGYQFFGDSFLGSALINDGEHIYFVINTYDQTLHKIKELIRQKNPYQGRGKKFDPFVQDSIKYLSIGNRVILKNCNNQVLIISDKGDVLKIINCDSWKLKVRQENKDDIYSQYKTNNNTKQFYEYFKTLIEFPEYLPAVRDICCFDKYLLMITYQKQGEMTACYLYSQSGEEVGRILLPLRQKSITELYPYDLADGVLYQLIEDADGGWGMSIYKIELRKPQRE